MNYAAPAAEPGAVFSSNDFSGMPSRLPFLKPRR
jgi:hypothetical protein